MKRGLIACAIFSLLTLPAGITLAENLNDHGSMPMEQTKSIMLGEASADGVTGMAHLNDARDMMAKMGKKDNFHFMIMFSDVKTGAPINQGTVAVKIIDSKTGKAGEAIPLMGMGTGANSHFGADVFLPAKGDYQFQVGSKLADGKKRQFTYNFTFK